MEKAASRRLATTAVLDPGGPRPAFGARVDEMLLWKMEHYVRRPKITPLILMLYPAFVAIH